MVKQNFCPTRLGIFFRGEDIHKYVEILKKYHNAVGRNYATPSKKAMDCLLSMASGWLNYIPVQLTPWGVGQLSG